VGEKVGAGGGARIDIALDPLEGATLTAKAMAGALSVLAFAPAGGLMRSPDAYMDKIAIGPGYPPGLIDLDAPAAANVKALAKAKGVAPSEVRVCVLDRPRHAPIIASLRSVGAKVLLLADGDVAGAINTTNPAAQVDLYLGQGGAPEGVLACAALKCAGGQFQGRFVRRAETDKGRPRRGGVFEAGAPRKYDLNELVSGDLVFAATGVTQGQLLDGVRKADGCLHTHTLLMTSSSRIVRELRTKRPIDG
jgi:fructose-1,6-bisphosphatase II / sedoheptulose-1,7-bisphosphatase